MGQRSNAITMPLLDFAAELEAHKHFRWAERLRITVFSITNNIAEGSGSHSKAEHAQFLDHSRRAIFETCNILLQVTANTPLIALPALLQEREEIDA